jgi:hypothetical protein
MVTCKRLAAKREDRLRFTIGLELRNFESCKSGFANRDLRVLRETATVPPRSRRCAQAPWAGRPAYLFPLISMLG